MSNYRRIEAKISELEPTNKYKNIYSGSFGRVVLLSYFEALYLSRVVFKEEKYKFFEESLLDQIWKTVDDKFEPGLCHALLSGINPKA